MHGVPQLQSVSSIYCWIMQQQGDLAEKGSVLDENALKNLSFFLLKTKSLF